MFKYNKMQYKIITKVTKNYLFVFTLITYFFIKSLKRLLYHLY